MAPDLCWHPVHIFCKEDSKTTYSLDKLPRKVTCPDDAPSYPNFLRIIWHLKYCMYKMCRSVLTSCPHLFVSLPGWACGILMSTITFHWHVSYGRKRIHCTPTYLPFANTPSNQHFPVSADCKTLSIPKHIANPVQFVSSMHQHKLHT